MEISLIKGRNGLKGPFLVLLHKTARNEVVIDLLAGYFYGVNSQNNLNDGAFGQNLILINMRMYMRCCKNMVPFQQPRLVPALKKCSTLKWLTRPQHLSDAPKN